MIWSSGVESATPTTTRARNSGGQFPTALTTPAGNDGATRAGTHAQPETVGACATPIVWLEGPLALCHRYYSFMSITFSTTIAPVAKSRRLRCVETHQSVGTSHSPPARYLRNPGFHP